MKKFLILSLLFTNIGVSFAQLNTSMPLNAFGSLCINSEDRPIAFFVNPTTQKGGVRSYVNGKWIDLNSSTEVTSEYPDDGITKILTDKKDRPIISYVKRLGTGTKQIVIKRFENNSWKTLGDFFLGSGARAFSYDIAIDSNNNIYIAYAYLRETNGLFHIVVSIYSDILGEFHVFENSKSFLNSMQFVKLKANADSTLSLLVSGLNKDGVNSISYYSYNLRKASSSSNAHEITSLPFTANFSLRYPDWMHVSQSGNAFALFEKIYQVNSTYHRTLNLKMFQNSVWSDLGNVLEFGEAINNPNEVFLIFDNNDNPYLALWYTNSNVTFMKLESGVWKEFVKFQGNPHGGMFSFFDRRNKLIFVQRYLIAGGDIPKYFRYDNSQWIEIWK